MANLFSYPFRVNPDGAVAKTPDGEDYYRYELVNLIMTSPGERALVPDYGIEDPVFDNLNTVELLGKVEMFGPPVIITEEDVSVNWPREGVLDINIDYNVANTDSDDDMINDPDQDDDDYYEDTDGELSVNDFYSFNVNTD
jgi:hypothetical protein